MQRHHKLAGVLFGAAVVFVAQAAQTFPAPVTAVRINPIRNGINIVLQIQPQAGATVDRPQVFITGQGNSWIANVTNAQLRLPQASQSFRQDKPAPGIASVSVTATSPDSIQVTVTGASGTLMGQVSQQDVTSVTLSLIQTPTQTSASPTVATPNSSAQANVPASVPVSPVSQTPAQPSPVRRPAQTTPPVPAPPASQTSPTPKTPTATPVSPAPQPVSPAATSREPVPPVPVRSAPTPPANPVFRPPISPTPTTSATPTGPSPAVIPTPTRVSAPVGNQLNYSDINVTPTPIDLGTSVRIDRLVLRETPVREVLALLARTADLGIIYSEDLTSPTATTPPGAPAQRAASVLDSNISLDIANEPIQDVFNYILRAKGLKANRVGRTIFIGLNLPATAGNFITRTLRLNQMRATLNPTNITSTMTSASSLTSGGGQGGSTTNSQVGRNTTITENMPYRGALQILEELGANNSPTARSPLFRGLQATADSRTNTLTLVGTQEQIQTATDYLARLDVRRKQVAINVRIVEVDLTRGSNIGASFSFGVADNFFSVNQGQANANFGPVNPSLVDPNSLVNPSTISNPFVRDAQGNVVQPPLNLNSPVISNGTTLGFEPGSPASGNPLAPVVTGITPGSVVTSNDVTSVVNQALTYGLPPLFQFPLQFLLRLQAQVTSGNAKILTDPTLIVQEGSQSQVNLTSQVFSGFTEQRVIEGNVATTRILPQPPIDVGVILNIHVDQIDDNNFITLEVSPEVSSPGQQITDPSRNNLLIQQLVNRRRLETGRIRLRDAQTLILTGIIQEVDRTITTKTPILGDIPILRLLFRNRREQRDRNEIVVLVTPIILDDSNRSPYGFNYLPGPEVQRILQQKNPNRSSN